MVFHYPNDPSSRLHQAGGGAARRRASSIATRSLWVNGVEQAQLRDGDLNYVESGLNFVHTERYKENLNGHEPSHVAESGHAVNSSDERGRVSAARAVQL